MRQIEILTHISGYNLREIPKLKTVNKAGEPQLMTDGDWEHACMGDADTNQLGRVPMGLWVARKFGAKTVIFSTGCSRRVSDGKSEAEVTYEMARERYHDLHGFFPHRFSKRMWSTEQAYHSWLTRVSVFDNVSKNTSESMQVLQTKVLEAKHRRQHVVVFLVTSANHAPRVLRDAELAFGIGTASAAASFKQFVTLCSIPAETNYGKRQVQDVKVDDLGNSLFTRKEWLALSTGVGESE